MDLSKMMGRPSPPLGSSPPSGSGMSAEQEQQIANTFKAVSESCPFKMVLSGTMGFGMGAVLGLFMSSMRYDTPAYLQPSAAAGGSSAVTDLPLRQQLSLGLKDMGRSAYSSARNFGRIGALFSISECCVEGLRGKNDAWNGVAGGAFAGGVLARAGGPQAVAVGAAGFAAFSYGIEWYMRSGENERRFPVI